MFAHPEKVAALPARERREDDGVKLVDSLTDLEARRSPLWGEVARLDAHALTDGVKAKRWSGELLASAETLLERYGRKATSFAVRLRRRRGTDEE